MNKWQARKKFDKLIEFIKQTIELYDLNTDLKAKAKLDKKVKSVLLKYPQILTIRYKHNYNIGMICVLLGLTDSAMVALDNHEASVQQDAYGRNIGMIAAEKGYEEVVLKALDNKVASAQQDGYGCNIGMRAAEVDGLDLAIEKALQNKQASRQKNMLDDTIEDIVRRKKMIF